MRSLPLPLVRRLVPLNGLQEHALQTLLEQCEWQLTGRGQRLFTLADLARFHIYLLSGEARLLYPDGTVTHTAEVPFPLGYGSSGISGAFAATDCVTLRVDKQLLDRTLCWNHVAAAIELDLSFQPEHDEEAGWHLTLLKSNLFLKVSPINMTQVFACLKPMQVKEGEVILRQGENGDGCYFIRRGTAAVTRRLAASTSEYHIMNIGHGYCLGEEALMHKTVRNATVTMVSDGFLMRLEKPDFMALLREPEQAFVRADDLPVVLAEGALLLDVRSPEEFAVAHWRDAQNAPLPSLRLLVPPGSFADRPLVVCCDSGSRSRAATSLLQQWGVRASYLLNGLDGLSQQQRIKHLSVSLPLSMVNDYTQA